MTYTSFFFFLFLIATAGVYFLVPRRFRYLVLLIASLGFYAAAGLRFLPFLLGEAAIAFFGALILSRKAEEGHTGAAKRILVAALVVIIGYLALTKLVRYVRPGSPIIVPVGLSYYTFSTISYLLDVYWKRYAPEKNPLKFLLFVSFFPHILQGPIPRYDRLGPQLAEGHSFEYRRVCFGVQLMLYGLFQKLVLADRLGLYVDAVFENYASQYGLPLMAGIFFYAIQIYMDFAGCVNIARGSAQIFGIELEENFRQPYFSSSVEEFWRRWHITLGGFFRDYVGMPVSVSKRVKNRSRSVRRARGSEAGRNVVTLSALAVVWLCTGLWHGTGLSYVLWALWQGGIIAIGTVYKKKFIAAREKLGIADSSRAFHVFRVLRTFFLAGIIPRVITRAPSVRAAFVIMKHCFANSGMTAFRAGGRLAQYNWNRYHLVIAAAAILVQLLISILKERGVSIRETVAGFVFPVRWLIYLAALFAVVIFGIYGPGYDAKAFVYMGF